MSMFSFSNLSSVLHFSGCSGTRSAESSSQISPERAHGYSEEEGTFGCIYTGRVKRDVHYECVRRQRVVSVGHEYILHASPPAFGEKFMYHVPKACHHIYFHSLITWGVKGQAKTKPFHSHTKRPYKQTSAVFIIDITTVHLLHISTIISPSLPRFSFPSENPSARLFISHPNTRSPSAIQIPTHPCASNPHTPLTVSRSPWWRKACLRTRKITPGSRARWLLGAGS